MAMHCVFRLLALLFCAEAAQPVHSRQGVASVVTSQGSASLLRSELQPKPRLPTCAGYRLQCNPPNGASDVDPCKGTDCKAHHACMGSGFQNCMVSLTGPSGPECVSDLKGCVPSCAGTRRFSDAAIASCRSLTRGQCEGSYVVTDNVATQCFATVGPNDTEVECENGSPCGDPERDNPYTGA
eukprot:Skav223855  [mRNA]  locus=scaffold2304:458140:461006:- [translate_table: standard]